MFRVSETGSDTCRLSISTFSGIWKHVQVMSSHTLVHPATPPVFVFLPLSHPCNPSTSFHPHSSPTLSALPLPVFRSSTPSSTVWTGCGELWPFFHAPPAGADPPWRGGDSEPGPGRVPGILLYQPAVPRERGHHRCHRAGLTPAQAETHGWSPAPAHFPHMHSYRSTHPGQILLLTDRNTHICSRCCCILSCKGHVASQCNSIFHIIEELGFFTLCFITMTHLSLSFCLCKAQNSYNHTLGTSQKEPCARMCWIFLILKIKRLTSTGIFKENVT